MSADLSQSFRIDPADLPGEAVIFGSTPAMREIRSKIDCVLSSDLPVLIQGESGTGKEVVARFLHTRSNRRDAPFVKLNCAAIPASLLESELFGFEKGSFTGANGDRPGLVEIADAGTLFLNEIGEMSWELQGKLLGLLQNGSYTRIGGHEERMGRVRVICATNIDLQEAVKRVLFARTSSIALTLCRCAYRRCAIARPISRSFASTFFRRCPTSFEGAYHAESSDAAPTEAVGLARKLARTGKLDCSGHHSRRRRSSRRGTQASGRNEQRVSQQTASAGLFE